MSLKTWESEFYPVDAKTVARSGSAMKCLRHSLQKWIGLLPENLSRHAVSTREISATSLNCALCQFVAFYNNAGCNVCPLFVSLGNKLCHFVDGSPYRDWAINSDPKPMIDALKHAIEHFSNRVLVSKDTQLVYHFRQRHSQKGGVTVVYNPVTKHFGVAICSSNDMFSKQAGYKLAFGRSKSKREYAAAELPEPATLDDVKRWAWGLARACVDIHNEGVDNKTQEIVTKIIASRKQLLLDVSGDGEHEDQG